jgi:hypothetical protein
VAELYDRFDIDTHSLGHLTKLKQSGTVEAFIAAFEQLAFRTEGMSDSFFLECFISGLKDDIRAQVHMTRPLTWLEATQRAKESQQVVFFPTSQSLFPSAPSPFHFYPSSHPSQDPKINSGING